MPQQQRHRAAEKLKQYGVSMSSIASDIAGSDITYPAGDTEVGDQKLSVSTEQPFETMDSLNDIPLTVSAAFPYPRCKESALPWS